jgi:Phosphatidylinositol kinase and protein kinases of the PI-3 kinase family
MDFCQNQDSPYSKFFFICCFQLLGVPELIPFRLTNQMITLLLPLKDSAPYKQYMMAAMHALRKQSSLLLNTMDVFIQEPLLDWQV